MSLEDDLAVLGRSLSHGFGTLRVPLSIGTLPPPPTASAREYLRGGLPGIYREHDFSMRFVGALETVLDPIVALLDSLPEHFDADLGPGNVLELLTAWLGIELHESQPTDERRDVVRRATELARTRGTLGGIRLVLLLAFPGIPFRVEDVGGVHWASEGKALEEAPAPAFVVYCDVPIPPEKQAAVARSIEQAKPVHVGFRLRVRAARSKA